VNTPSAAQAVEALIQEYGRLVFHTLYGMTNNWEESQDLTQETFLQALKGYEDARAKSGEQFHARAWLMRIALNEARMQRRRQGLYRFLPLSRMQRPEQAESSDTGTDELRERAAAVQPLGYGISEAEDMAELVSERDAVQRTLAAISEPLRVCLVLSIVGQFSSGEIADMLKVNEATVRQRLARARKQFQQLYRQEDDGALYEPSADRKMLRETSNAGYDQNVSSFSLRAEDCPPPTQAQLRSPSFGRNNAQRFNRQPALAPLR
jgi:RNA polymerase sigma-70 factor (ECF subfamily)